MKILTNPLWGVEVRAFEILRKKFKIDEIYAIEFEDKCREFKSSSLMDAVVEEYMFLDMIEAKYDNYLFYNEMAPIDQEILDKMAPYEPEALKMLERAGKADHLAEQRFLQYHTHVRYWNYFLDRTKVDCFITGSTPHSVYDYIIMRLCQIKGVPAIQNEPMPFQSCCKILLYTRYEEFDVKLENAIKRYKMEFEINPHKKLSERMQREYDLFNGSKERIFKTSPPQDGMFRARIYFFGQLWERDKKYALARMLKHFSAKRDTKHLLCEYGKMTVKPSYKKKYIYFPLHYQPERSTSPNGGWFVHQYLAIEMLSHYLPEGAVIYVKEHPRMKETLPVHTRVLEHYKRICKLKNVFLVPIDISTVKLADHATAIASVTGHVGFEVLFKKKPYLMFGNSILKYAPNTLNIRTNDDCRKAVDQVFGEGIKVDEADVKAFLMAVDDASVETYHETLNPNYGKRESLKEIVRIFSGIFQETVIKKGE